MEKGKVKSLVVNNKAKSIIILAILMILILLVSIISLATSNQAYVVEIKDDGSENIAENIESSLTKKIVAETSKSLTYEVAIKNLKTRTSTVEVAVLVDTSSSMPINDIETQTRQKAIEFIQGLFADVSGVRVSLSNNKAVKYNQGSINANNCVGAINGLTEGEGSNLKDGINNALSTFSNSNNDKYLIIFSDATDPVLENLQSATENGINIYSILTDMTNNEYTQNATTVGNVQMISHTENFSSIYNKMNNSIVNVKVTDIFTQETSNYFTFEEGTKNNDLVITKTANGYEIECENIKAGETKTAQFTLTLDENAGIDAGKIYRELNTSNKMTIDYDNHTGDKRNYEMKNSPTYIICKKYSLTIEAVSEKSDKLPVSALQVNVVGTIVKGQDEEGNDIIETIYNEVLTTDSKGKIKIDELKTLGDIKFEIKPMVDQFGYSDTDATTIIVHNDPKGVGTIWAESDVTEPEVDVINRNINVKLPISVQTFALRVETIDSDNSNIKLGNIEYRLIQPKLNSKYEMEALYGTTDENGSIIFRPAVMTKNGTYEYILSQLTEQESYDSMGNVTLYVTFENGNVTKFSHKYNENVESQYISTTEEKVIVKNVSENTDTFRLEINVTDSQNSNKKLEGAIYNIEITRVASNGEQVTNTINGCITNAEGKIELDLPGKGNVRVRITEVTPRTGYQADTQTKEIIFSRTDGRVQYITAKNPIDINAVADSDANALVVNFTSIERSAKNRVQIHMIDNDERDINIPGVNLTLVNLINNKTYNATSDANGIANFLVDDEEPGIYAYDIILTKGLPYGYLNSENKLGGISVHFNDDKFIDECSNTTATVPYFSANYKFMEESDYAYHTGFAQIALAPDAANANNFQVKLVDENNKVIPGAKYDITIESGDIARRIIGRQTDSNGMLTTKLIGTDEVRITVKETESIKGHVINTQEQIIELSKINGKYQIINQEPYIYDISSGQKIGAEVVGNNIIYHDVNKQKTGDNTILNLYVNKMDTNKNLVGGVKTILKSETLKLSGAAITEATKYTGTSKSGNVFTLNPAISDNNGYFEVEGIEVNGLQLNNGERVDYLYMYEIDNNGNKISNTDITLKLTFRYNENKDVIQVTNVEATWGNRLVANRTFDGYETSTAYESNVYLDIYTNYDDVGNFSLDLIKTDKNDNKLQGAKYDVIVTRLDGTRVVRRGIEITDSVEFEGFLVAEGTKIEITEVEAPIGYELNEYTEILTIKSVDPITGEITVELENSAYKTPRAELQPLQRIVLQDGSIKTCAELKLRDYELATFKFGIIAKDTTTTNPISGYKFKISTSQGAQKNTEETNTEGKTYAIVGANYKNDGFQVIYTVDTLRAADYYKKLASPIQVIVVFDLNGEVRTAETIAANEANKAISGYGTLWSIEATNTIDGNDIDIKVNIEPQEKLIVNIISQDRRTKQQITDIQYGITPSYNIPGVGTTQVEVGYVVPDAVRTYTIEEKVQNNRYAKLENQSFKIEYDSNGDIKTVSDLSNNIISETHNGKEITITIAIEPTTIVKIVSQDRISGDIITENEYEIADSKYEKTGTTQIEVGYAIPNGEHTYTLRQTNDTAKHEVLNDQTFKVVYDDNDNVTAVTELSDKIINATFNNAEITLTLELEPLLPVTVNIISKDSITGKVLYKIDYEISHIEHHQAEGTTQIQDSRFKPGTGSTQVIFNYAVPNGNGKYTLKQTNDINEYVKLNDMEFELTYDDQDRITAAQSNAEHLKIVDFNERTLNVEVTVEPGVPFVITNIGYFDNLPLSNAKFEIVSQTPITKTATTDVDGIGITYVDKLQEDTMVLYKIKQTEAARTYCTVEEFEIEVTFNENKEITSAKLRDSSDVNKYVTFVTVGYKQPSEEADKGYNGNDKGIINIEVKNYPAVQFEITNVDRQENTKIISGTNYKVTSSAEETDTATTNPTAITYVGRGGFSTTVTYSITELSPASRYQTQLLDSVIEVDFDNQGIIRAARIIKNEDITTLSLPGTTTYADSRKVNVQIESNKELAIKVHKQEIVNNSKETLKEPVTFEVTARIEKSNLSNYNEEKLNKIMLSTTELTEEQYLQEVLDRLKITNDQIEEIKQNIGLEKIKQSCNLTPEEEDQVAQGISYSQKANILAQTGKTTITAITEMVNSTTIQEVIDSLIRDGKTTQDEINDILVQVKDLVRLDVDRITTSGGYATAYMDKTLESKTIEYTLKETKKPGGYLWPKELARIEVTYDSTGKMITDNPVKVISGDIEITSFDIENFSIEASIVNHPSPDIKVHLISKDTYDTDKKLETAKYDAYLIDQNAVNTFGDLTFVPDSNYKTTLATGSMQEDGTIVHGEDIGSIGEYKGKAGTRILRLVEKQRPNTYYIGNDAKIAAYRSMPYAMLISVTFDDEGFITNASLYKPGEDSKTIGYISDSRYLTISHSANTIEITVKYYPMLQVQMVAKDMYTDAALQAKYTITTDNYNNNTDNYITTGYIGNRGNIWGRNYGANYTTNASLDTINGDVHNLYGASKVSVAPTEADNVEGINVDSRTRTFYIYENQEPTRPIQYQKYRNRYLTQMREHLIAIIRVTYNDKGEISDAIISETRSNNNIQNGFIEMKLNEEDPYVIQLTVKYAPITTISAKVIDQVTGQGIEGIRVDPYYSGAVTSTSYEYRRELYYVTGASGTTGWTYWGGSIEDGKVTYKMKTSNYYSDIKGGYFNPGEIVLDVSYDGYGRVSAVDVKSVDQFGDANAINVNWTNNNINITIPYCRQFIVQVNKVDYYDSTAKLGGSVFRIESEAGVNKTVAGNNRVVLGKVYAGKTVKYTLTETTVPSGYVSVGTLDFFVTFNNDGTVRSATSPNSYYQYVNRISLYENVSSGMEINIKNKASFNVGLVLSDKFYPTLKLEGATFEMSNSKGDTAQGGLATDSNGVLQTYIGPVYPNEEVTYTIKQLTTANGYYMNSNKIEFKVRFNKIGNIEAYTLINGSDIATINPNKHMNTKSVNVNITNMPKDVKVGIYKYDKVTNQEMSGIKFNVKTEEVGKVAKTKYVVTNDNGTVIDVVDEFVEKNDYRIVKYTISEVEVPNTYRKIQDVVIQVTYNADGSIFLYDVLSNESNLGVEVATNKQIKYVNNLPVHIKLTIPNDNSYDLIIKNEDRNYPELGIEGTKYDVTINGNEITPTPTDKNGITKIVNRTEKGEITIKITEREIGEGYRQEPNNETTIVLQKGEQVYSLALDTQNGNSNQTYAQVVVDEDHGTVTVTFKNETKLELNIIKDDISTGELLQGAIFEVTSEEVNQYGNVIPGTLQTISNTKLVTDTSEDNAEENNSHYEIDESEKSDENGLIHFDIGTAPMNKTIQYTLTEVIAPEGYTTILPIKVTVKFDAFGRITNIQDDSFRAQCYLDSNTGKSHNMIFNISNGTIEPQYTVKVVSADAKTGTRINGSIFQVEVIDSTGATHKQVTGTTRDIERTINGRTFISEKGVMKVTGIKAKDEVTIALNQTETATGYVYGSNKISGNVKINTEYISSSEELEESIRFSIVDNGGFDVSIDNANREITIKVKNDPELTFDITKIDGKTKERLSGAEFTVTSVIQTSATTTPTTLNETSKLTDENGHTTLKGGIIEAGKTIIYTLKENKIEGYNQLDDIVLLVQYDTNGNIIYYEILSDENDARVIKDKVLTNEKGETVTDKDGNIVFAEEAKILETKRLLGESDVPGIVEAQYSTYKVPTGIGSKILQLEVSNTKEAGNSNDYKVVIEKHHELDPEYPYFISGVTFNIKVKQEYGKAETTWTDITDENGIITSPYFSGYGKIVVEITEIATVDGLILDPNTKTIEFTRNKDTHKLDVISSNVNYSFSDDNSIIYLKPVNEIGTDIYNMVINKVDKNTNALITNNPANIEIYKIDEYETITEVQNEETGEVTYESTIKEMRELVLRSTTDKNGRIVSESLKTPEKPGTYKYIVVETKAPEGYLELKEETQINVTFEQDEEGKMIITNAVIVKGDGNVSVTIKSNKLLSIIISNTNENDVVQEGNYTFDIIKVDKDKNAITSDTAIFKLTNIQTNEVTYYETNEQGRLEIPTFEMPNEAGKYIYKLNEVKSPTGYVLNVNDIMVELEFAKNEEGKIYLSNAKIEGDNIEYIEPEEGELPDTRINIKVINEEGGSGTGNTNNKRYTFVLNKVDADTKEIITENVEFEIVLANGEIVKGKTNDKGQLRIEDIFMPAQPGEYELVIKEKSNPSGYKVDDEIKVVKVTFTGYAENMVISNIELGDTNNKNIEILEEKCTEQYIEVNILNEKENPELYVISKRDEAENDIYDVLKGYDVAKKHYKIDKPFIDTKVAKYGSNVTVQQFIDNLESNGHMVVLDEDGKEVAQTARVKTGMTLQSTLGNQKLTFTIVVKGDANGDGRVTTVDLNMLTNHLTYQKVVTDPIKLRALDLSNDGRITTVDLNKMYQVNIS